MFFLTYEKLDSLLPEIIELERYIVYTNKINNLTVLVHNFPNSDYIFADTNSMLSVRFSLLYYESMQFC